MTPPYTWPLTGERIRAAITAMHRTYPDASIWYGSVTGSWWAILPGWDQLLEARDPIRLARLLGDVSVSRHVQPAAPPDRGDGSWRAAPQPPAGPLVWTQSAPHRHRADREGGLFGWLLSPMTAGATR